LTPGSRIMERGGCPKGQTGKEPGREERKNGAGPFEAKLQRGAASIKKKKDWKEVNSEINKRKNKKQSHRPLKKPNRGDPRVRGIGPALAGEKKSSGGGNKTKVTSCRPRNVKNWSTTRTARNARVTKKLHKPAKERTTGTRVGGVGSGEY